jgi:hypothetical protein
MNEMCFEGYQLLPEQEQSFLLREVLHPDKVGRRIAFLIAEEDPKNLTKKQRKVLGRGIAKIMCDMTVLDYMVIAAKTYSDMDGLQKVISDCS